MQDADDVLKTLGLVFGLFIWLSAFQIVWPMLPDFVPRSTVLAYLLWWSLPFAGFFFKYHRNE